MPQGGPTGALAAAAVPMWRGSRQWLPGTDEALEPTSALRLNLQPTEGGCRKLRSPARWP